MKNFSLKQGAHLRLHKRHVVVEECQAQAYVLRDFTSQSVHTVKATELSKAYADGDMVFMDLLAGDQVDAIDDAAADMVFADYPPNLVKSARIKLRYLQAISPRGQCIAGRRHLSHAIHEVWCSLPAELRDAPKPSISTFYLWRQMWINSGYSLRSLINRHDLRGRKPAPVDERLKPILEDAVYNHYLSSSRPPVADVLRLANAMVIRQNKVRSPFDQIPKVSYRQLLKEIARQDRFEALKQRYGVAHARTATRVFGERTEPLRPLQRVEVDHTPLDVLCLTDDLQMFVGRPYATALIDVCTRMILGMWISFREPNANSVMRAMKHAILPKDRLLRELGIKGSWPAHGIMETLVVDNGKEFHSDALEAAAEDLGISILYCPPREPFYKGVVERFLKELNYNFVHRLPGTTFAKYYEREDYQSEEHVVLTMSEVQRLVTQWVVKEYSLHFHRGIQASPLQVWEELVHPYDLRLPKNAEVLNVVITQSTSRKITSKGIEINGLRYASDALQEFRSPYAEKTLTIRPNPDNLGSIQVLHPRTQQYFQVPCTRPGYAQGLTLEQHKLAIKLAKKRYAALPHQEALLTAKLEMQEEVAALAALRGKESHAETKPQKLPRGKRSGQDKQAKSEFAHQHMLNAVEAEPPTPASNTKQWSFDGIEAFPSGQANLNYEEESHA